jgi:membrane fusion protein (multidrug efflux system)
MSARQTTLTRSREIRWIPWFALAALLVVAACSREVRSDPSEEPATERRLSLSGDAEDETAPEGFSAFLYSERDAEVFTRMPDDEVSGSGVPISAIHVEVGDRVATGQLLATLRDDIPQLEVESIRPEVDESRLQLERLRELHDRGVVSDAEYEAGLFSNQRAEASLKWAELYLSRTQVRAPFSGVVSRRYVRQGQVVDETVPLFRVTSLSPLRARLLVPEDDVGRFTEGEPVTISDAVGRSATGRVIIVAPTVDAGSGTREVVVEMRAVGEFRPGASVIVNHGAGP